MMVGIHHNVRGQTTGGVARHVAENPIEIAYRGKAATGGYIGYGVFGIQYSLGDTLMTINNNLAILLL